MKIIVDQDRCTGHARCNATVPDLYEIDDYGFCAISQLEVPSGREKDARAGGAECPEQAIKVVA